MLIAMTCSLHILYIYQIIRWYAIDDVQLLRISQIFRKAYSLSFISGECEVDTFCNSSKNWIHAK